MKLFIIAQYLSFVALINAVPVDVDLDANTDIEDDNRLLNFSGLFKLFNEDNSAKTQINNM